MQVLVLMGRVSELCRSGLSMWLRIGPSASAYVETGIAVLSVRPGIYS